MLILKDPKVLPPLVFRAEWQKIEPCFFFLSAIRLISDIGQKDLASQVAEEKEEQNKDTQTHTGIHGQMGELLSYRTHWAACLCYVTSKAATSILLHSSRWWICFIKRRGSASTAVFVVAKPNSLSLFIKS